MLGALRVITPPVEEPLSVAEVRDHLRITDTTEEPLLESYLTAVRVLAEKQLDLSFLTQTLEWTVDSFPYCYDDEYNSLLLPRPPLQSVTSIKYIDTAGVQQTWSNTLYLVDTLQGRITPAYGQTWPQIRWQPSAVVIRYVAGSLNVAVMPEDQRQMLRLAAGTLYEFRESLQGELSITTGVLEEFFAPYRQTMAL